MRFCAYPAYKSHYLVGRMWYEAAIRHLTLLLRKYACTYYAWLQRIGAQCGFRALHSVKLPSKNFNLTLILIIRDVGRDTVKEPTVVR